jgi:predicted acylesterase/phospholipase RssA
MTRLSSALLLLLLLSLALSGCAISVAETPPHQMCDFQTYRLEVSLPDIPGARVPALDAAVVERSVAQAIRYTYTQAAPPALPADDAMLFLSGGSQEGAFGAGLLHRWSTAAAADGGRLPSFRVVTGISTGAILATPAFINRTELSVAHDGPSGAQHHGYAVLEEGELLRPIARTGGRGFGLRTALPAIRHGAVADLEPLRRMLFNELGPVELGAVAAAYGHRLLLVGVVDVDSGQAVALDLTEMAHRYTESTDAIRQERLRHCYVDAIVASSSAPLAALPVFIDNRMYVDGGARFGLFSDEIDRAFEERAKNPTSAEAAIEQRLAAANVYAIVNGDLTTQENCGRRDSSLCDTAGTDGRYGAHADWHLLDLAFRSERILVNQVQRMSLERIHLLSKGRNRRFFPAWIQPEARSHLFPMDHPRLGSGRLSCAEWRAMDVDLLHPIQFHPRQMHCLIDYGRWEFDNSLNWHRPPAEPTPAVAVPGAKS